MSEVLKVLLIRHGQSIGNLAGRMSGQDEDELSPLGVQQSQQLAQTLYAEAWHPDHIYSSPLRRARQTAEILRAGRQGDHLGSKRPEIQTLNHLDAAIPKPSHPLDIPITCTAALTELHGGIFQGLTWPEAQTKYPDLCHQLESAPTLIPVPGAESAQAGRQRAHQFIHQLLRHHGSGEGIWVISHGGILQHLVAELLGYDRVWGFAVHNTARFEFWLTPHLWHSTHLHQHPEQFNSERWQIRYFNDTTHLMNITHRIG